ncbi:MAG: hypothetical protein ACRDOL_22580 [Streptosporangiaceae bacterium]
MSEQPKGVDVRDRDHNADRFEGADGWIVQDDGQLDIISGDEEEVLASYAPGIWAQVVRSKANVA